MKLAPSRPSSIEMEEEKEYQRQLALFVRSSTEKGIELVKLGEILSDVRGRDCFLDIGAGGGDLTIPVSQSFKQTTVVEPNEQQARFLKRRCPDFTVLNDHWERVDLEGRMFDFILCSHVLYYIKRGMWQKTIAKMHDCLAPGGSIAVVLQSPIGQVADFFNHFATYEVDVMGLWRDLIQRYGDASVDIRYFINEIWTEDLEDMADIGLFLLLDPKFRKRRAEIRDYFAARHKVDHGYRIDQDEILLAIKKPEQGRT